MTVLASFHTIIEGFDNNALLSSIATIQQDYNLACLQAG
jgi:hypothetical protein